LLRGNCSISIYQADAQPYASNTSNTTYAPSNPATQARYPTVRPTRQAPTNPTYHHINGTGEGHEESHATGSAHQYYQNNHNHNSVPRPPQIQLSSHNYPDQGMYYHQTAPVYARELILDDETATSTTESGSATQQPQQTDQYAQEQQAWLARDTSCSPYHQPQSHCFPSSYNPQIHPPQVSYFLPPPQSHYDNNNSNSNSHSLNSPYPLQITTSPRPETGPINRYTYHNGQWPPVLDPADDTEHPCRISAMPEREQFHPLQQPSFPDKMRRDLNRIKKWRANQDEEDEDERWESGDKPAGKHSYPLYECHFKPCPYKSKRESNCKQHMERIHGWVWVRSKGGKSTNIGVPGSDGDFGVEDLSMACAYHQSLTTTQAVAGDVNFQNFESPIEDFPKPSLVADNFESRDLPRRPASPTQLDLHKGDPKTHITETERVAQQEASASLVPLAVTASNSYYNATAYYAPGAYFSPLGEPTLDAQSRRAPAPKRGAPGAMNDPIDMSLHSISTLHASYENASVNAATHTREETSSTQPKQLWWRAYFQLQQEDHANSTRIASAWIKASNISSIKTGTPDDKVAQLLSGMLVKSLKSIRQHPLAVAANNSFNLVAIDRILQVLKVMQDTLKFNPGGFVWACLCSITCVRSQSKLKQKFANK
jgi:hypothetical protein